MPPRVNSGALLRVSDDSGRILRTETLCAGSDLRDRLCIAHANYQRQGWAVNELRPGAWAFMATKGRRRLLVAIRPLELEVKISDNAC